jgi:hypothetical protein
MLETLFVCLTGWLEKRRKRELEPKKGPGKVSVYICIEISDVTINHILSFSWNRIFGATTKGSRGKS